MPPPIGIVGWEGDEQVAYLIDLLHQLGAETVVLDTRLSGGISSWRWSPGDIRGPCGERLEELGAVYVRAIALTVPETGTTPLEGTELEQWCAAYSDDRARHAFATGLLLSLEERGIHFVNSLRSFWTHGAKGYAAALLRRIGLRVPRTLVTTDPDAVGPFVARVGRVVYKPAGGGGSCRLVEEEDLQAARLALLRRAPCLFQEFVPGDNIRLFVLDGRVISSTLICSDSVDYRGAERGLEAVRVPEEIERQAVLAASAFGMAFTGIDVRRTPAGEHVFLDVNPAPMFIGFELGGGQAIGEPLARHLLSVAERRAKVAA